MSERERTCADCIDAATDSVGRAYSRGKTFEEMLVDLRRNSGRMFNPDLVALFDENFYADVTGPHRREH